MSAFQDETLNELQALLGRQLSELLEVYREESERLFDGITAAIAEENRDQLLLCAHSLKGAAGNLGAMRVHECSNALELAADTGSVAELGELREALAQCHAAASRELAVRLAYARIRP